MMPQTFFRRWTKDGHGRSSKLDEDDRTELNTLLAYPDDSAGGLMQTEVCSVEYSLTVRHAIEAVRECVNWWTTSTRSISSMMVGFLQVLLASKLWFLQVKRPFVPIERIGGETLTADLDQEEVAQSFSQV